MHQIAAGPSRSATVSLAEVDEELAARLQTRWVATHQALLNGEIAVPCGEGGGCLSRLQAGVDLRAAHGGDFGEVRARHGCRGFRAGKYCAQEGSASASTACVLPACISKRQSKDGNRLLRLK